MKYFKGFFICLVAVVLLTGCGSKKLTCSQSSDESGMKTEMKYTIGFKSDKPSTIKTETKMTATSDEVKESWSMMAGFMELGFADFKDKAGVKIDSKNDEKKYTYTLTMDIDLNKISDDDLEGLDLSDIANSTSGYDDVKKDAEDAGFTCK